jgi:hypothetical protein
LLQDKRRRIIDHASEHCSDLSALFNQDRMLCLRQIEAVAGEIELGVSFAIRAIVAQRADATAALTAESERPSALIIVAEDGTRFSNRTIAVISKMKFDFIFAVN